MNKPKAEFSKTLLKQESAQVEAQLAPQAVLQVV